MRIFVLVAILITGLSAPAFAQKAEIERANAKWVESFNKGDFAAIASLYTDDAASGGPQLEHRAPACGAQGRRQPEQDARQEPE